MREDAATEQEGVPAWLLWLRGGPAAGQMLGAIGCTSFLMLIAVPFWLRTVRSPLPWVNVAVLVGILGLATVTAGVGGARLLIDWRRERVTWGWGIFGLWLSVAAAGVAVGLLVWLAARTLS